MFFISIKYIVCQFFLLIQNVLQWQLKGLINIVILILSPFLVHDHIKITDQFLFDQELKTVKKKYFYNIKHTYGWFVDQNRLQAHLLSPNIDYIVADSADVELNNQQ